MADGDGDGDDEQRAEAVPNEIPNDCDMATELVPKEIKNDHRAYREVYWEVDRHIYQVDKDCTEAAYREHTYEVDRMVTEADFERWLPNRDEPASQCRAPMTTGCKIYSIEVAEAER